MSGPLNRGAAQLHVDDAGTGGFPVIFQHGLCGDARQTAECFPDDPAFRRVTVECRGHGRSGTGDPEQFSIATFADDVSAVVEALGAGSVVVGGISMGAAIALRLAVRRPDLVRALIIMRPAWIADEAPINMAPNKEVGDLLARLDPVTARDLFMAGRTAADLQTNAPDNLTSLLGFFDRQPHDVTAALLKSIPIDGPGVTPAEIALIGVPTLVIGHEHDAIHPLGHARELARMIPAAQLITVTPKVMDKARYVADVKLALGNFLKGF